MTPTSIRNAQQRRKQQTVGDDAKKRSARPRLNHPGGRDLSSGHQQRQRNCGRPQQAKGITDDAHQELTGCCAASEPSSPSVTPNATATRIPPTVAISPGLVSRCLADCHSSRPPCRMATPNGPEERLDAEVAEEQHLHPFLAIERLDDRQRQIDPVADAAGEDEHRSLHRRGKQRAGLDQPVTKPMQTPTKASTGIGQPTFSADTSTVSTICTKIRAGRVISVQRRERAEVVCDPGSTPTAEIAYGDHQEHRDDLQANDKSFGHRR